MSIAVVISSSQLPFTEHPMQVCSLRIDPLTMRLLNLARSLIQIPGSNYSQVRLIPLKLE